jgi:AraC-like DNA-binding protein
MAKQIKATAIAPILYSQIGFRPELEAEALAHLDDQNVDGCRNSLGSLLASLTASPGAVQSNRVVPLLLDSLHKVNWQLHRAPNDGSTYQANRVMLIEQFASCQTTVQAFGLFLPLLNRLLASARAENSVRHPLIERAKRFIHENYQQRLVLSTVAAALNISPNYLSRVFRKETGYTLTAFTQRVRIEHARRLLANGRYSISEIAYLVGYQNYRDFHRNFVKHELASPREIRNQLRIKRTRRQAASHSLARVSAHRPAH